MSKRGIVSWVVNFYKKYLDHFIKILVILISVIYPFILLSVEGELKSLSQYWNTSLQPLFIVANVMTAYIFLSIENWKMSSFLLILVTAFSVKLYGNVHNILAVLFFLSCLYPLFKSKRFKFYGYLYLLSPLIGILYGLLYLEIYSIIILCGYHLHTLIHILYINYQKYKIENDYYN
jgi:hypothetical protein